jgi:hypothetical protein
MVDAKELVINNALAWKKLNTIFVGDKFPKLIAPVILTFAPATLIIMVWEVEHPENWKEDPVE